LRNNIWQETELPPTEILEVDTSLLCGRKSILNWAVHLYPDVISQIRLYQGGKLKIEKPSTKLDEVKHKILH